MDKIEGAWYIMVRDQEHERKIAKALKEKRGYKPNTPYVLGNTRTLCFHNIASYNDAGVREVSRVVGDKFFYAEDEEHMNWIRSLAKPLILSTI